MFLQQQKAQKTKDSYGSPPKEKEDDGYKSADGKKPEKEDANDDFSYMEAFKFILMDDFKALCVSSPSD